MVLLEAPRAASGLDQPEVRYSRARTWSSVSCVSDTALKFRAKLPPAVVPATDHSTGERIAPGSGPAKLDLSRREKGSDENRPDSIGGAAFHPATPNKSDGG